MTDFETSIAYVLANEGGTVNNPKDKGGPTSFGVTIGLLSSYLGRKATMDDINGLDLVHAKKLYEDVFWTPMQLDQLPQQIATAMLDVGVNQGPHAAITFAQRALGFAVTDGVMGPKTIAALGVCDQLAFLEAFVLLCQEHYADICVSDPSQLIFLKGWLRRAFKMFSLIGLVLVALNTSQMTRDPSSQVVGDPNYTLG